MDYARNHGHLGRQVLVYSVHDDPLVRAYAQQGGCTYMLKGRPRYFKDELDSVLAYDPLDKAGKYESLQLRSVTPNKDLKLKELAVCAGPRSSSALERTIQGQGSQGDRLAALPYSLGGGRTSLRALDPDSWFRPYADRRPCSLKSALVEPATTLLLWGIANPFGPSLGAVVAVGDSGLVGRSPVIHVMLHPFQPEAAVIGELGLGSEWQTSAVIPLLFDYLDLSDSGCPSLVLPSMHLDPEIAVAIHAQFLRRFGNCRRVLEQVTKYLGNPLDRISEEVQTGFALLNQRSAELPHQTPLTDDEASQLALILLSTRHTTPELQAFAHAYYGSIHEAGSHLRVALDYEAFRNAFGHLASSCLFPAESR